MKLLIQTVILLIFSSTLVAKKKSCSPCEFTPPKPPKTCAFNAPAYVELKCPWDLFVTGSYLYWQAKENDIELGIFKENQSGTNPAESTTNSVIDMDFEYKSGFKIGLGKNFCRDDWDVYIEYLWFHHTPATACKGAEGLTANGTNICPSFLNHNIISDFSSLEFPEIIESSSCWALDLDKVDLMLGRNYFVGKCLVFHPAFGLRWMSLDQKYEATYSTSSIRLDSNNNTSSWGIGPFLNLNTSWNICYGFRIFADAQTSILFTDYDYNYKQTNTSLSTRIVTIEWAGSGNDICFLRPQLDLALGLGFGDYLNGNCFYFDLTLGYELHVLFDQNMFIEDIITREKFREGNLYLHGLTVSARLDF